MTPAAVLLLIRHELRILRSSRASVAAILAMALTLIGGAVGSARWWYEESQAGAAETAGQQSRLDAMMARLSSPGAKPLAALSVMGQIGAVEVLDPLPAAALSIGHGDVLPSRYRSSTTTTDESIAQTANLENPSYLQAGRFDLSFVLVYLYPLFILALAYDLISSEREGGTLSLTLSQAISMRAWIAIKLGVRMAVISVAAMTIVVVALAMFGWLAGVTTLLWIGFWFTALLGYGAFWFSAAAATNILGRAPSSVNGLVLSTVWLVLVLIVPMTVNVVASLTHPLPSRVELIGAFRTAEDASRGEGNGLVLRHYTDHSELIPDGGPVDKADLSIMLYKVNREAERLAAPVLERFETQLAGQRELVDRYTWISPAMSMQALLDDIAGTGTARYERFRQQVIRFNRKWHAYFEPLIFRKATLNASDLATIPLFEFQEEPTQERIGRILLRLAAILFPTLILTIAVIHSLRAPANVVIKS
jgi:ABC-2 type transport system permease protein